MGSLPLIDLPRTWFGVSSTTFSNGCRVFVLFLVTLIRVSVGSGELSAFPLFVDENESIERYLQTIKPMFERHCYACHSGLKQEGGLRLDTAAFIIKGGDSGPVVNLQDVEQSEILQRVVAIDDSLMPPRHEGEKLSDSQVKLISEWIEAGITEIANEESAFSPDQHWAFQPIKRPLLPNDSVGMVVSNPIDQLLAGLSNSAERSITEQETHTNRAPFITQLRRLSIGLRGLPLEEDVVNTIFQAQHSRKQNQNGEENCNKLYDEYVEKWLADSAYGERWGRHWMDIWRYSDWWGLGEELRNSQLHMWHWRDWIIESLNENVPYDEMLRQMIAADELYPEDEKKLRATGFLARNFFLFNRNQWMDETVEHVGKGMLGLTMNCAKCHDHKYDPISQMDYYRFRAIFEPYHVRLDIIEGEHDVRRNGLPRVFDRDIDSSTYLFIRGEEAKPDKSKSLLPGVPSFFTFADYRPEEVRLPPSAYRPEIRKSAIRSYIIKSKSKITEIKKNREQVRAKSQSLAEKLEALSKSNVERDQADSDQLGVPAASRSASHFIEEWPAGSDLETLKSNWELYGGEWKLESGMLRQVGAAPDRAIARLLKTYPLDFEAEVHFTTIGGSQWKSVGLSFDCTDENPLDGFQAEDNEVSVYASAFEGEQKIQIAFVQNGQWIYPADGKVQLAVDIGKPHRMKILVRDQLVNIHFDEKLVLAWNLPRSRKQGALQLTTFDAQAHLERFYISPLDKSAVLKTSSGAPSYSDSTVEGVTWQLVESQQTMELLNLELAVANEELTFHQSRLEDPSYSDLSPWAVSNAMYELKRAEIALDRSDEKTREAKTIERDKAKSSFDKIQQGDLSEFKPTYPGTKWSATRFQFSGKDDPDREFPETSSGRRSELAEWITSPENPLTARVAVNHIWSRHFGEPLVRETFDMGMKSKMPLQLDLLNWLAAELIEHDWDMKHIHRLIVRSDFYKKDHRSVPRLESQTVRDSLLDLAGKLDRTMGGPAVTMADQSSSRRRSVYFFHSNNERNLFLSTFDEALVTECYRREESIVPQQALAMSHSKLVLESVPVIAERIQKQTDGSAEHFVEVAFAWILGIEPSSTELRMCVDMLNDELGADKDSEKMTNERAISPFTSPSSRFEELVWVLLNHHHFLQVP